MINRIRLKTAVELFIFIFVFCTYCLCISDSINFWDSPEFIASSFSFQASHPPGAPLYTIVCHIILSFVDVEQVAIISNGISAFFGALTVLLVFKIIYVTALQILRKKEYTHKSNNYNGWRSRVFTT